MKQTTRAAFAAAIAADAAVQAAHRACEYHELAPNDWALIDQAYWLCHEAVATCQRAADSLDPKEALEDETIPMAFQSTMAARDRAQEAADDLVTLATKAEHEIRR